MSSFISIPSPLPPLSGTLGPLFLSGIFSSILWGAGSVQLYFYHENYSKSDKLWLQLHLLLMYVLDTVHQILLLVSLYTYLVKDFSSILLLESVGKPISIAVILSNLVCVLAQSLYLTRIWHLSKKNYVLTTILAVLVTGQFVVTFVYFAEIVKLRETTDLMNRNTMITVRILNAFIAASDTSLASTMAFLLHSQRPGIKQTDSLINRLIMYSFGTGLVTGVLGLVAFISAFTLPNAFFYLLFDLLLPKLYVNSILALLNVRQKLRGNCIICSSRAGLSMNRLNSSPMGKVPAGQSRVPPPSNAAVIDIRVGNDQAGRNDTSRNMDPWQKMEFKIGSVSDTYSYAPETGTYSSKTTGEVNDD